MKCPRCNSENVTESCMGVPGGDVGSWIICNDCGLSSRDWKELLRLTGKGIWVGEVNWLEEIY